LASRITSGGSCRWFARPWRLRNPPATVWMGGLHRGTGTDRALLVGAGFARSLAYAWASRPSAFIISRDICSHRCSSRSTRLPVPGAAGLRRPHPAAWTSRVSASIAFSGRHSTMRRGKPSTRRPNARIAVSGRRRARPIGRVRSTRPIQLPAADARPAGTRLQFQWLEDGGLVALRGRVLDEEIRADVARGFQEAWWIRSLKRCAGARRWRIPAARGAGGVGANMRLRERLGDIAQDAEAAVYFPRAEFCTDNGAMIALAGALRLAAGERRASPSTPAQAGSSALQARRSRDRRTNRLKSSMTRYSFMPSRPSDHRHLRLGASGPSDRPRRYRDRR